MKKILISLGLVAAIGFLFWFLIGMFTTPIDFNKTRKVREERVVERLKDIRTAQRAYRSKYGRFVSTLDSLVEFVKKDSLEILLAIGSEDDSTAVAKGLVRIKKMVAVNDTIFNERKIQNPKFDVENLRYIPFSQEATGARKEFQFGSAMLRTESGVSIPVFQAFASYIDFLGDLDEQLLINYRDERVNTLKKDDGLKVGSLTSPNNEAGNWE